MGQAKGGQGTPLARGRTLSSSSPRALHFKCCFTVHPNGTYSVKLVVISPTRLWYSVCSYGNLTSLISLRVSVGFIYLESAKLQCELHYSYTSWHPLKCTACIKNLLDSCGMLRVPRRGCATTYWPPHAGGVLGRRAASSLLPKRELMIK